MHRWFGFVFLVLLFASFSSAQTLTPVSITTTPAQPLPVTSPIWDAIHALQDAVQQLTNDLAALGHQFANYKNTNDAALTDLNQTDAGLQNQINNITSTPAFIDRSRVYQVVSNDVNSHDAFCSDNNDILLMGYCSNGFLGEPPKQQLQLFDGFGDFEMSSNPPWTILYGNFVVGPITSGTSAGDMVCASSPDCEAATPTSFSSMGVVMQSQVFSNQPGDQLFFGLTDNVGVLTQSFDKGYMVRVLVSNQNSSLDLYRLDGGTSLLINHIGPISLTSGPEYTVRAERNESGYWQFYLDSVPIGAPVLDQLYTGFSYFHTKFDGYLNFDGGRFDNITAIALDSNSEQSGFLNVDNPNEPLGIRCQNNGSARVLCLEQN